MHLKNENEEELPTCLNYLREWDWGFIRADELQARNGMQQEPGQTLMGDIFIFSSFQSISVY